MIVATIIEGASAREFGGEPTRDRRLLAVRKVFIGNRRSVASQWRRWSCTTSSSSRTGAGRPLANSLSDFVS
jgi:hypothetical protein